MPSATNGAWTAKAVNVKPILTIGLKSSDLKATTQKAENLSEHMKQVLVFIENKVRSMEKKKVLVSLLC